MKPLKTQMNEIYRDLTADEIPWHFEQAPAALKDLLDSGRISPCTAVDLGCGLGAYTRWLAAFGFAMTGLDLSDEAVAAAAKSAETEGASITFAAADLTTSISTYDDKFDFAFDWEVLHHVFPAQRVAYLNNVWRMLRPGGKYFSVCFSAEEPASFAGEGRIRKTRLGTELYFSSEAEMRKLYESVFHLEELRTIKVEGKNGSHLAISAFMSKPSRS